jgi:hypothetical protein
MKILKKWGQILGAAEAQGEKLPLLDGLIAATAACNEFTVVTRNVKDLERFPISLINPWEG